MPGGLASALRLFADEEKVRDVGPHRIEILDGRFKLLTTNI